MKKELKGWSYFDHIQTHLQRQEIDKIIKDQREKPNRINIDCSPHHLSHSQRKRPNQQRLFLSTRSIPKNKFKFPPTNRNYLQSTNLQQQMNEQMSYFSIIHHYDRVINSNNQEQLVNELREQLSTASPNRFGRNCHVRPTSNFFQGVSTIQSRIRRNFIIKKKSIKQQISNQELYLS